MGTLGYSDRVSGPQWVRRASRGTGTHCWSVTAATLERKLETASHGFSKTLKVVAERGTDAERRG